jgi:hypothetical protein
MQRAASMHLHCNLHNRQATLFFWLLHALQNLEHTFAKLVPVENLYGRKSIGLANGGESGDALSDGRAFHPVVDRI